MASTAELRGDVDDRTSAMDLLNRASKLIDNTGEQWCAGDLSALHRKVFEPSAS
jgi:hypothetical protein